MQIRKCHNAVVILTSKRNKGAGYPLRQFVNPGPSWAVLEGAGDKENKGVNYFMGRRYFMMIRGGV